MKLSVVIPCHNELDCVDELYSRLSDMCAQQVQQCYELIIVDDGSTDGTWQRIEALAQADAHVVGVELSRNYGHQIALSAGLSFASGERTLIIDADLQDPPELLGDMMRLMDDGADVVYGQRSARHVDGLFKRSAAAAFYRLLRRFTDIDIPLDSGDFRLLSRRVVDALVAMPETHRFIRGMASWVGFRQVPLHYERQERFSGTTKYPWRKSMHFALDALTGFSTRPLRLASYAAALFALAGVAVIGYALNAWLRGAVVPGWTSVVIVVLILGSAQLFFLGIFGEYVGRIFQEVKRRPLYLISRVVRADAANQSGKER